MNYHRLLDEYSPVEASRESEYKLFEWIFILLNVVSIIFISLTIAKVLDFDAFKPFIDIMSQSGPLLTMLVIGLSHGIIIVLFLATRRVFSYVVILGWLGALILHSIIIMVFTGFELYNFLGILLKGFWLIYFAFSTRMRLRFTYPELFARAVNLVECPECSRPIHIGSKHDCSLSSEQCMDALEKRIINTGTPQSVRAAQIIILAEKYGEKALSFLQKQYTLATTGQYKSAEIASALLRALRSLGIEPDSQQF